LPDLGKIGGDWNSSFLNPEKFANSKKIFKINISKGIG
jgi:hypothetical protein